jgi:hypothetical protein
MGIESSEPGKFEEIIERDGKKYRVKDSGYTIREYFSHEGPGWDTRWGTLVKYGVSAPEDLPEVPYYSLEEVEASPEN